jgi:hypothetical protein
MELEKFSRPVKLDQSSKSTSVGSSDSDAGLVGSGGQVVRTCIARIPPGYERLELSQLLDAVWGVDGFDT